MTAPNNKKSPAGLAARAGQGGDRLFSHILYAFNYTRSRQCLQISPTQGGGYDTQHKD